MVAPLSDDDVCALLDEFDELACHGKAGAKAVVGLQAILDIFAEQGRQACSHLFHEASKKDGLYRIRKGDLRLYFFFHADAGELIICSHATVKKQQETAPADIARAVRMKKEFDSAKRANSLNYIGRDA